MKPLFTDKVQIKLKITLTEKRVMSKQDQEYNKIITTMTILKLIM